jgi:hypothetical protein
MSNTALYHESLSLTEALMNYRHQPISPGVARVDETPRDLTIFGRHI